MADKEYVAMPKRSRKKKQDLNTLANYIVNQAVSKEDAVFLEQAESEGKNLAAVMLGRLGGLKGGKARAAKLSAEKRSEIAQKAAKIRWANNEEKNKNN